MDTRLLEPPIKGKRCFEIQGTFVTVDERYSVQNMIGCGAYGVVYSAYDSQTKSDVAIKKIQTAFADVIDAKRILREIKILSKQ
jgi:serine/threonine protein kinase